MLQFHFFFISLPAKCNVMKKFYTLFILLLFVMNSFAQKTDYAKMWKEVETSQRKDLPQEVMQKLDAIRTKAAGEQSYGNMLAAEVKRASMLASIEPDSLAPALDNLMTKAHEEEEKDKILAAIYYAVAGRLAKDVNRYEDKDREEKAETYFDLALSNPELLMTVSANDYLPLVYKESLENSSDANMLDAICHEAERMQFLEEYYLGKGMKSKACLEAYHHYVYSGRYDKEFEDVMLIDVLRKKVEVYSDVPECGLLASLLYEQMTGDEDYSQEAKYHYLQDALNRWGDGVGAPLLRNNLKQLTQPSYQALFREDVKVLPGIPAMLNLCDITNIKELTVSVTPLKADGTQRLDRVSDKKLAQMKEKTPAFTLTRHYDEYEDWQQHNDSIEIPALKPGVYALEVTSRDDAKLNTIQPLFVTDLKLLGIGLSKNQQRLIVVSETTGKPVPGATIVINREDYNGKVLLTRTLKADNKGRALWESQRDRGTEYFYVHTSEDKAFRKTALYNGFYTSKSVAEDDIVTIFTDRSIYRPGQTMHVALVVHNAKDEKNVHAVGQRSLGISVRDSEYKEVFSDTLTTDASGHASVDVLLPEGHRNGNWEIFACDVNGKLGRYHKAHASIKVEEYKRPTFEIVAPKLENRYYAYDSKEAMKAGECNTVNLAFDARTFTQMPLQDAKVTYTVTRDRRWWWCWWRTSSNRMNTQHGALTTDASGKVMIPVLLKVPQGGEGIYSLMVRVKVTNQSGETHEEVVTLDVATTKDAKEQPTLRPEEREEFFDLSADEFPANKKEDVTLRMGSTLSDVTAYYVLRGEHGVVEEGTTNFSKEIVSRTFRYAEAYGEGLTVSYVWVKNGKAHTFMKTIRCPRPDMHLKTHWTTFRDLTQPGATERWTLHIDGPASKNVGNKTIPTDATLIATLFDHSLDQLAPHAWGFTPLLNLYSLNMRWGTTTFACNNMYGSSRMDFDSVKIPGKVCFDGSLFRTFFVGGYGMKAMARPMMATMKVRGNDNADFSIMNAASEEMALADGIGALQEVVAVDEAKPTEPIADLKGMVRSDFAETAYFATALHSDKDGNITMEFTLPESVTTWRMLGFVHNNEMRYNIIDTTCVARKEIMIQPNMPRFLRYGDRGVVSASVTNNGEARSVDALLQVLNPETEEVLLQKTVKTDVAKESTATVSFDLDTRELPQDDLFIVRVAAIGDSAQDGEQHYLPVLPASEKVMTTIPFTIHGPGEFHYDVANGLFTPNSTHRSLALEYTANPAWLVVQALPYVGEVDTRNCVTLASAIYANTLAFNIMQRVPHFDASKLKMKTDYFDKAKLAKEITVMTSELKDLQQSDGSWTWYKGMGGSPYLTVTVAEMLARLSVLADLSSEEKDMLSKSMNYLGQEAVREAAELRKLQRKHPKMQLHPSETITTYIYCTSLLGTELSGQVEKDVRYMVDLMEKVPTEFTIFGKARAAVIFAHNKRTKKAKEYIESIRQYSVCTEEAGRYYSTPKAYYSWCDYRIPTQVAAIEALSLVAPMDAKTIEEMKRWLLHEKRTTAWTTPVNAVNAVYAFFLKADEYGNGAKTSTNEYIADVLHDELGYSKTTLDVSETKMVTVANDRNHTSWGAIYAEQVAPLSEVKATKSGIGVKREVLVNGKLAAGDVAVGDKVTIRITLDCERDYDFVEVCDHRAACLEPVEALCGYRWGAYRGYYQEMKDQQANYYFDHLSKGKHVIETDYFVDREGSYLAGTCSARCAYAPEFTGHSTAAELNVTK